MISGSPLKGNVYRLRTWGAVVPGVQAGREEDMDDILAMLVSRQEPCWSHGIQAAEIHEIFIDWDEHRNH